MTNVWPCYEGNLVTQGGPWAELPLSNCEELLDLSPVDYLCGLESTPHFGEFGGNNLGTVAGYRHVIVEVGEVDAAAGGRGWKPGFYRVRMSPAAVYDKLGLGS